MAGPLQGYRIVDLTSMISGPSATMLLADQGAEVIKVENPASGGDHTRLAANRRGGFSASFLNNNRGKRSVALDLKNPVAVAALLRVVARADVFVQNFRPGVAERMGLGETAVRAAAPDIVYVSISGFGESGPYAQKPTYDPLIQAVSGLATVQAGSDEAPPRLVRTILPDKLTGIVAAQAITAALLARARGGPGQHVRLSMLDAVVAFLWGSDMGSQTFVEETIPQQEAASFIDLIYATETGYISVAVQSDKEWAALTRALDRPEWLADPRFATPALRQRHINERLAMTQEVLRTRGAEDWLERLTAEGVACAPVLTRTQLLSHPQVLTNGIVVHPVHPAAGPLRQARPAARFSVTEAAPGRPAPALGAETREVLAKAGLSEADIDRLVAERAP
jgi:crotonobetainyl-CoA:carnitine CoA-transferase CaiB-like acyl-CoA transferase